MKSAIVFIEDDRHTRRSAHTHRTCAACSYCQHGADRASRSLPVAEPASRSAFPPLVVARTDELYKPACSKWRLIRGRTTHDKGVQRAVAIYSLDNGRTWGEPSTLFSLPRNEEPSATTISWLIAQVKMHFFLPA